MRKEGEKNKTQKQLNLMPTSLPVTMTTVRRPLAGTLCCAITLWCLVCCAPLTRPGPLLPAQEPTQREEQSIFLMSAEKNPPTLFFGGPQITVKLRY